MMIRMVGGWVILLVPAHPGSPWQRAVKRLLLLLLVLTVALIDTSVVDLLSWKFCFWVMCRVIVSHPGYFAFHCLQKVCVIGGSCHSLPLPSSRHHQSYSDCLEDNREIVRTILCCVVYDNCAKLYAHTHTYEQFVKMSVRLFRFSILCVFLV